MHDTHIVVPPIRLLQQRQQAVIQLHGHDLPRARGQLACQRTQPRANFQHDIFRPHIRRVANTAEDVLVKEKVLAQTLASVPDRPGSSSSLGWAVTVALPAAE